MSRLFSREVVEVTLFRWRYLDDSTKLVELVRKSIKLKPFLDIKAGILDLADMGNEFPLSSIYRGNKQHLSLIPKDEAELFGDNYEGQFFRHEGSYFDVAVQHSVYKDDLRIQKRWFSFKLSIPALNGMSISAKFKGRLRRGRFKAVLKGQGLWKTREDGERGDLFVELIVK